MAEQQTLKNDLRFIFSGFLMGGADIIPGVSGGTVALIVGVYERLVTAISHFDQTLVVHLIHQRYEQAANHIDLRFLITLGAGIGIGVISLAGLMHYLLLEHHTLTLAGFFGLIAASSWLVSRIVKKWTPLRLACCLAGAVFAFWLVGLPMFENPPDFLAYYFFCGMIAICAMILPGISGAFILVLLGKYAEVTGIIKGLIHLEITPEAIAITFAFGFGCILGLIGFSKVLKSLLKYYESITMAVLCGFMIGSLRKLWPFQKDLNPAETELKYKQYEFVPLSDLSMTEDFLPALVMMLMAAGFIIFLDWWGSGVERAQTLSEESDAESPENS